MHDPSCFSTLLRLLTMVVWQSEERNMGHLTKIARMIEPVADWEKQVPFFIFQRSKNILKVNNENITFFLVMLRNFKKITIYPSCQLKVIYVLDFISSSKPR